MHVYVMLRVQGILASRVKLVNFSLQLPVLVHVLQQEVEHVDNCCGGSVRSSDHSQDTVGYDNGPRRRLLLCVILVTLSWTMSRREAAETNVAYEIVEEVLDARAVVVSLSGACGGHDAEVDQSLDEPREVSCIVGQPWYMLIDDRSTDSSE